MRGHRPHIGIVVDIFKDYVDVHRCLGAEVCVGLMCRIIVYYYWVLLGTFLRGRFISLIVSSTVLFGLHCFWQFSSAGFYSAFSV